MMRNAWFVAGLVVLVVTSCGEAPGPLAPLAPPDALSGVTAGSARVVGSGHNETAAGLREFTFHALDGPQAATGGYKVVLPNGLFFEADVTCVSTAGNTGWVGGIIRDTNAAVVVIGSRSMFYAIDDGEGEGAADLVSLAVINAAEGADLAFCADQPLALPTLQVTQGNVQVR